MNEFVSIEILSTTAGCSLLITLLTQIFKRYLPQSINTKWLALLFSVIIGVLRIIYVREFSFEGIVAGIFNIFVLLATAIGIYEIGSPVAQDVKTFIQGGTKTQDVKTLMESKEEDTKK